MSYEYQRFKNQELNGGAQRNSQEDCMDVYPTVLRENVDEIKTGMVA